MGVTCPSGDLYAHKLDAYSVVLNEQVYVAKFSPTDQEAFQQTVEFWRALISGCGGALSQQGFQQWLDSQTRLLSLGLDYQAAKWHQRWFMRKQIREQERIVAFSYVEMITMFERETGIAIRWDRKSHALVKGMISTARGSDRVADYIQTVYSN